MRFNEQAGLPRVERRQFLRGAALAGVVGAVSRAGHTGELRAVEASRGGPAPVFDDNRPNYLFAAREAAR